MNFNKRSAEHQYYHNCDNFILALIPENLLIEIEYESDSVHQDTKFCIQHNNKIVHDWLLKTETNSLKLNLESDSKRHILKMSMLNKRPDATIVDNGIIVKDTFVKLLGFKINNYDILGDINFYQKIVKYKSHQKNEYLIPMPGFWEDATIILEFDNPFDLWYNTVSTKNVVISESLKHQAANDLDLLIKELEESVQNLI
jgi:hypothetical protein